MEKKIAINEETLKNIISEIFGRMEKGSWLSKKVFGKYPEFMKACAAMGRTLRDWRSKIDTSAWNEDLKERIDKEFDDAIYIVETLGLEEYEPGEKPTDDPLYENAELTNSKLRKIVRESIGKTVSEQITHSEIEYYLEHILMDFIHDEGQKVSSTINRYLIPSLKDEMSAGVLNNSNIDVEKLNELLKALDEYADIIDNSYTNIYKLASDVLKSRK